MVSSKFNKYATPHLQKEIKKDKLYIILLFLEYCKHNGCIDHSDQMLSS